jgi:hypothetical protein
MSATCCGKEVLLTTKGELKGFFFVSRPKHNFGDTNDVFHENDPFTFGSSLVGCSFLAYP